MSNQEWAIKNGQSRMGNQEWTIKNGQSRMSNQEWTIKNAQSRMHNLLYTSLTPSLFTEVPELSQEESFICVLGISNLHILRFFY
jgi:hypothetical protein